MAEQMELTMAAKTAVDWVVPTVGTWGYCWAAHSAEPKAARTAVVTADKLAGNSADSWESLTVENSADHWADSWALRSVGHSVGWRAEPRAA
jgi:hypothetical protein